MIHTVSWSGILLVRDSCSCLTHRLSVSSLDNVNGEYKHKVCVVSTHQYVGEAVVPSDMGS